LNAEKDMKVRYATKAAAYYRKRNAALATAAEFTEEEPSYEEGRCNMYDGKSIGGGEAKDDDKEKADQKIVPEEKEEPISPGDLEFEEPVEKPAIVAEVIEKKEDPADLMGKMKVGIGSWFTKAKQYSESESVKNT